MARNRPAEQNPNSGLHIVDASSDSSSDPGSTPGASTHNAKHSSRLAAACTTSCTRRGRRARRLPGDADLHHLGAELRPVVGAVVAIERAPLLAWRVRDLLDEVVARAVLERDAD